MTLSNTSPRIRAVKLAAIRAAKSPTNIAEAKDASDKPTMIKPGFQISAVTVSGICSNSVISDM